MYLARDKDGRLFVYKHEPEKSETVWNLLEDESCADCGYFELEPKMCQEVKWKDKKPWLISDFEFDRVK